MDKDLKFTNEMLEKVANMRTTNELIDLLNEYHNSVLYNNEKISEDVMFEWTIVSMVAYPLIRDILSLFNKNINIEIENDVLVNQNGSVV